MSKTMWAASFDTSSHLARVTIENETDKSYTISGHKDIVGWSWFGKRTQKIKYNWFETPELAIQWLSHKCDAYIKQLENDIANTREEQQTLTKVLANLESQNR